MQEENSQKVNEVIVPGFGRRFLELFPGLNKTEIADLIGVAKSAVTNYANDRVPKLQILFRILELRPCSLDWLLKGEEDSSSDLLAFQTKAQRDSMKEFAELIGIKGLAKISEEFDEHDQWLKAKLWFTQWAEEYLKFTDKEWSVLKEIAKSGDIGVGDTIAHLVREALAAKGFGEMPEMMPVMVFQAIDDEVFKLIDKLPEEKRQDEMHRLIGKLVAKAAAK